MKEELVIHKIFSNTANRILEKIALQIKKDDQFPEGMRSIDKEVMITKRLPRD